MGIDRDSSDHVQLTEAEFGHLEDVCYVDCQFPKVPADILAGRIDVGIRHHNASRAPQAHGDRSRRPHFAGDKSPPRYQERRLHSFPEGQPGTRGRRSTTSISSGWLRSKKPRLAGIGAEELAESSWSY